MKRENFFYKGSKVHYIKNIHLALCGSGWLNGSQEEDDITCEGCKRILTMRAVDWAKPDSEVTVIAEFEDGELVNKREIPPSH